jgi:hypothetical protein
MRSSSTNFRRRPRMRLSSRLLNRLKLRPNRRLKPKRKKRIESMSWRRLESKLRLMLKLNTS